MAAFVYRPGHPDADANGMVAKSVAPPRQSAGPHFWSDPYSARPYVSPLSGREVSSRRERREEMRRFNVREVDPSEGPHRDGSRYSSADFIRKHRPPGY